MLQGHIYNPLKGFMANHALEDSGFFIYEMHLEKSGMRDQKQVQSLNHLYFRTVIPPVMGNPSWYVKSLILSWENHPLQGNNGSFSRPQIRSGVEDVVSTESWTK